MGLEAAVADVCILYTVYAILALSMELEYGELGLPNFAKAAFFAVGAFSAGALSARLGLMLLGLSWEGSFKERSWYYATLVSKEVARNPLLGAAILAAVLVVAVAVAAILGVIAAYPMLRLREDYLAITLIALGEVVRVTARNFDTIVGGTFGAGVVDVFAWAGSARYFAFLLFALGSLALLYAAYHRLSTSRYGRILRSIRDDELAALALGRNVWKLRMKTLALGSALAAVAGVIYALYMGAVNPDDFSVGKTFVVVMMVVLGGRGNPSGPLAGAALYILLDKILSFAKHLVAIPLDVNYLAYIIFGASLLAILRWRPEGLIPEKPPLTLRREVILSYLGGREAAEHLTNSLYSNFDNRRS
uniref:Branched-chain amino acid ABC transporter permease n=1 Tax=Thermofilum pendens TaxID=2269 RepID=A0A7C4B8G4_THEPE